MTAPDTTLSRDCPCCEGQGCEECDGTGKRTTTYLAGGRFEMRISGSGPLTEADKAALRLIGELAYERLKGAR